MVKQFLTVIISFIISALMLVLILIHTSATETKKADRIKIDNSRQVTFISDHGEKDGINTLKFSLSVKAAENADIYFEFEDISSAKVTEYRYHADEHCLNIYISGTQPLFKGTDSLVVGRVKAKDSSGNDIAVRVYAMEGSLKFTQGNLLRNSDIGIDDPNGDNKLDIRDAAYIARMLAEGKKTELTDACDYNGDGTISVRDAAAIAKDMATGLK